ncbi:MAG: M48 family metalloprotease [Planctomycetota bacterium]
MANQLKTILLLGTLSVLRMSRARVLAEHEAPALFCMVEQLARRAELPMQTVAIVADQTPNAFATGRSPARAIVAVTEGLLHVSTPRELQGVLAHELAHVKKSRHPSRLSIVNPMAGLSSSATDVGHLANLFSTHPPIRERIRRLRAMAAPGGRFARHACA